MQKRAILIIAGIALSLILAGAITLSFLAKKDNLTYNFTQELVNSASWRDLILKSANANDFNSSLTSQLSKAIADNLAQNNPNGPQTIGDLQNALQVSSFDTDIYKSAGDYSAYLENQRVNYQKQIKISNDNSLVSQKNYVNQLFAISDKYFSGISFGSQDAIDTFIKTGEVSQFNAIYSAYQNVLKDTLTLATPKFFLAMHKQYVDFYATMILAMQGIKDINDDPMRAALAIQVYVQEQIKYPALYASYLGWGNNLGVISLKK